MALDWLFVKIPPFDWLREMFVVTCNFRHVNSKKKCLLTPLAYDNTVIIHTYYIVQLFRNKIILKIIFS